MKLKEFLNSLPRGKKSEFARQVGIDPVYLSQIAADDQGPRKFRASAALAVRIEKFSNGVVNRSDLRPDDWQEIWPELAPAATVTSTVATQTIAIEPLQATPPDALRGGIVRRQETRRGKDLPIDAGRRHIGAPYQSAETGVA